MSKLPKNKLLAANKICTDYFEGNLQEKPGDIAYTLEVLMEEEMPSINTDNSTSMYISIVKLLFKGTPFINAEKKST